MSQPTEGLAPPTSARQLQTPAALALADLTAIFDDLQFVLKCCERLIAELAKPQRDDVVLEALWACALSSYARCFQTGKRGMSLSDSDLTATGLKGDIKEWHSLLMKLRDFYLDKQVNPRETFSVGVSQAPTGEPEGIVITSVVQARVDETTVQQTGRLAFELSRVLDDRIKEQQTTVFTAVQAMSTTSLGALPAIEVVAG